MPVGALFVTVICAGVAQSVMYCAMFKVTGTVQFVVAGELAELTVRLTGAPVNAGAVSSFTVINCVCTPMFPQASVADHVLTMVFPHPGVPV